MCLIDIRYLGQKHTLLSYVINHGCISDIAKTIAPTMVYSFKQYNLQHFAAKQKKSPIKYIHAHVGYQFKLAHGWFYGGYRA